jgi:predicted nucleic acid-binding protein
MTKLSKIIVVDANILIRAVLGIRTFSLMEKYSNTVKFYTPEICYQEVAYHIPSIAQKRHLSNSEEQEALKTLEKLKILVIEIKEDIYGSYQDDALSRIKERDAKDWSIIALSLAFNCPIWTEDNDFFGTGVATWRTKNIEIFLRN